MFRWTGRWGFQLRLNLRSLTQFIWWLPAIQYAVFSRPKQRQTFRHGTFDFQFWDLNILFFFSSRTPGIPRETVLNLSAWLNICTRPFANERRSCWPIACIYFVKNLPLWARLPHIYIWNNERKRRDVLNLKAAGMSKTMRYTHNFRTWEICEIKFHDFYKTFPGLEIAVLKCHSFSSFSWPYTNPIKATDARFQSLKIGLSLL